MATKKQATTATQKQYDKKLSSRGKLTDANNKARMDKLTKPSPIKDLASKPTPTKHMATKSVSKLAKAGRIAGAVGAAGIAGYAVGTALNKKYKISDKIVDGVEKLRDAVKKRKSLKEHTAEYRAKRKSK